MAKSDTDVHIGKFNILRRLGRGGMGAVYEGRDPALDRLVAIKTLTAEIISDKDARSRFEREARAAAKLQHPNIVTIYELGNFGGEEQPYIVMEYLEGTDVASLIGDKGLPIAEALEIVIQLCNALDFAHRNGVVHRDIKPANLRYLDNGQIKIMDFGIARIEGSQQITKSNVMVGTLHYMSPEQIRGEKPDGRTDIFSTGCILYELLTGVRPFTGDSATAILFAIVNDRPTPALERNQDVPQEIQDILDRALAKDREERFATAGAMARELEKILEVYRKTLPRTPPLVQQSLEELEALSQSGDWKALVPKAKTLVESHPQLDDARRHLRRALRELRQNELEAQQSEEDRTRHLREISHEISGLYGEHAQTRREILEETEIATVGPTSVAGVTAAAPTEAPSAPSGTTTTSDLSSTSSVRALAAPIWALVVLVLLGLAGGAYWLFLREPPGPKPITQTVHVRSEPPGASVFLDGSDTGLTTDGDGVEIEVSGMTGDSRVVELRLAGYAPSRDELTLADAAPGPLQFTLSSTSRSFELVTQPEGVTVTLDGDTVDGVTPMELTLTEGDHEIELSLAEHQSRTVKLAAGADLPSDPIPLTRIGRPGTLRVEAPYPVAIRQGDREIAAPSSSPTAQLRPGRHDLRLYAPDVFLNRAVQVTIRESETATQTAPPVGRFNVRANPGNCTVAIDGIPAGSPPFMNQRIVTGTHQVVFTWSDGSTDTQTITVEASKPAYVIGQKP